VHGSLHRQRTSTIDGVQPTPDEDGEECSTPDAAMRVYAMHHLLCMRTTQPRVENWFQTGFNRLPPAFALLEKPLSVPANDERGFLLFRKWICNVVVLPPL